MIKLSLGVFQKRLMESYRNGKERPLMDALTVMMTEAIMALCNKCQSDRLVCALKPLCGDRKYTSLLADMGASEDEIKKTHAFCLSNHLSRLSDISENKEPLSSVKDAKFPLSAFVRVVLTDSKKNPSVSSFSSGRIGSKELLQLSEQAMTRVLGGPIVVHEDESFLILGGKNGIIQVDIGKQVVTLNPENELIRDSTHLRSVVEVLSTMYSLDIGIETTVEGIYNLNIVFEMPDETKEREQVAEELGRSARKLRDEGTFSTVLRSAKEDHVKMLIELRPPVGTQFPCKIGFSYSYLRNIIQLAAKASRRRAPRER
jgi:hypothetical protein